METDEKRIRLVWANNDTSVILRRGGKGEKLRVRICGRKARDSGDEAWLKEGKRIYPHWNQRHKCWEVPKSWFNELVERFVQTDGSVYVVQPYREQEVCAPACRNAQGFECQCQCMGEYHGSNHSSNGWFEVSETFATRWGEKSLACRLINST